MHAGVDKKNPPGKTIHRLEAEQGPTVNAADTGCTGPEFPQPTASFPRHFDGTMIRAVAAPVRTNSGLFAKYLVVGSAALASSEVCSAARPPDCPVWTPTEPPNDCTPSGNAIAVPIGDRQSSTPSETGAIPGVVAWASDANATVQTTTNATMNAERRRLVTCNIMPVLERPWLATPACRNVS